MRYSCLLLVASCCLVVITDARSAPQHKKHHKSKGERHHKNDGHGHGSSVEKGEEYDPLFEEEAEPKVVSKRRYGPDYPTEEEYHAKSQCSNSHKHDDYEKVGKSHHKHHKSHGKHRGHKSQHNKAAKHGNDYAYDEEEMVEDIPHMMDNVDVEEAEEIEKEIVEEAVEEAADKVENADELLDAAEQEAVEAVAIAENADEIPVAAMDNLAAEAVMMHDPTFGDYAYGGDYEGGNAMDLGYIDGGYEYESPGVVGNKAVYDQYTDFYGEQELIADRVMQEGIIPEVKSGDDVVEEIVEKKVNDVKMLEEAAEEEQEEAEAIIEEAAEEVAEIEEEIKEEKKEEKKEKKHHKSKHHDKKDKKEKKHHKSKHSRD